MRRWTYCALLTALAAAPGRAEEAPVRELRVQRVGDRTYFHVTLRPPEDLAAASLGRPPWPAPDEALRRQLTALPRLIPQDDRTAEVYLDLDLPWRSGGELGFYGQVRTSKAAELLLLYEPRSSTPADTRRLFDAPALERRTAEARVALDLSRAKELDRDDESWLRDRWAKSRVRHLQIQQALSPGFGYFRFAAWATAKKYDVALSDLFEESARSDDEARRRLYELTTGGAALTESLAQRRLLGDRTEDRDRRTIPVARVRGIDVPEHPWKTMMAGRKPREEPLATLCPFDQYYASFRSPRALVETAELIDLWGGNLLHGLELHSADHRIRQRYEAQLCLPSARLAAKLDGKLLRGVAVTGSDLALREGSDVTVLFHVSDRDAFLEGLEPYLKEARDQYGDQLQEDRRAYRKTTISSFVTPLREVSLYRAAVDDFVICSNSPAAIRRVLDTHAGRRTPLSDSLDFQYMRTVFVRGDGDEDGFAFLSDAFIRQLVGPESKIKTKRRLEALASLTLATHAALYAGAETGRLPADHKAMLAASGLRAAELEVPEGKPVFWDGKAGVARSEVYGTLRFATPLLELPLDRVTPQEKEDYDRFREDYIRLWRRYFDPVGLRLALSEKEVRMEAYILPLIQSSAYNDLRWLSGGKGVRYEPPTSGQTVGQFQIHLDVRDDQTGLGNWLAVRLDDGPALREMTERQVWGELTGAVDAKRQQRLFWKLPITVGLGVSDGKKFRETVQLVAAWLQLIDGEPKDVSYEGVEIRHIPISKEKFRELLPHLKRWLSENQALAPLAAHLPTEDPPETAYSALIEDGYYLSLSEGALRGLVDAANQRRKRGGEGERRNAGLLLNPTPPRAAGSLRLWLEWETHRRALANNAAWEALLQGRAVRPGASARDRDDAAYRLLGFTPVSPDGAGYVIDVRTATVSNRRHGSYRAWTLHTDLDGRSPLRTLLGQLKAVRSDLRFCEDGIHTTLTLQRQLKGD
jgi:hypothetical protein